jgi:thioester reductase-like protein
MATARATKTLITGVTGYVGARLAERLLATTDDDVILWVHAADIAEARAKVAKLAPRFAAHEARLTWAHGELGADAPFADVDANGVRAVVHAAAVTRFNVDEATAQRVNTEGAAKVFDFAARCPRLEDLTYVSTAYAAGLAEGPLREVRFDDAAGFANHYERSKFRAEEILFDRFGGLPSRVARVATIIADDAGGVVTQQNAVHNTLKLFFHGLISLVPGKTDTPLYFVTGEEVVEALTKLVGGRGPRGVFHLAHRREESLTLDELIDIAFATFAEDAQFVNRRVLKPLYTDAESFDMLVDGLDAFGGDVLKQAVTSVAPFARQLFVTKEFDDTRAREHAGWRADDPRALTRATCAWLVKTRWGKNR